MKKILGLLFVVCVSVIACTGNDKTENGAFKADKMITVVSREDGSGTRGAFIELFGILQKGSDGSSKDLTTKEANIANKTDVMLTTVSGDEYAIGYISLGSLNDTVKALNIDNVTPTMAHVKDGSYKVSRPFIITTKGIISPIAQDFINFILSQQGQAVVGKGGYIAINDTAPQYKAVKQSGKVVVAGSSSVSPIMEKLKEAYLVLQPSVNIEIQMSDSTAGIIGVIDGTCDIGMASRSLKESEKSKVSGIEIALDGIAVIVNKQNPTNNMNKDQIKKIFTGEIIKWNQL